MTINITDMQTYRRLAAVGSNEFWYEDIDVAAGTLVQLAASAVAGQLDTTDQLSMFELAQKIFIVNGPRKKVADFANVKLTMTAMTDPPAHGDILTQGTSPNQAFMVVDFVNTAKTAVYGFPYYSGTTTAWATGTFTSNNAVATMNPATVTVASVTVGPHWYDWTVYPAIKLATTGATKTFGEMPEIAYLGCAYRGRPVLSGNPKAPFQWYMGRQLNPWDWAYMANDAQSPVAGGNADAGQLGDIIRSLMPYKDDYLVFGCASTMHVLAGDPASSGELRELSLTTGQFGASSFCWGADGQLYFFGNSGLCRTTVPGIPTNISQQALPQLIHDAAANQSTHRVTMAFDRLRNGIVICITKLSDGTSTNYWYDLRVVDDSTIGGFFPEVYPAECGAYSLYFYDSPDPAYRSLLVGGADGYLRKFDDEETDDELHATEAAIESNVTFGPYAASDTEDYEGMLTGIDAVLSGGSVDSSDVNFEIYTAKSSESLIKLMAAGVAKIAGIFKAPGRIRGTTRSQKVRGNYLGFKVKNNNAGESWGFEKLLFSLAKGGRLK